MKKCYLCFVAVILFVSLTITNCAPQVAVPPTSASVPAATATVAVIATTKPACDKVFKVAWVTDAPVGDKGWTDAHNAGRLYVQENLPCVETAIFDGVAENDAQRVMFDLAEKGYQMIFACTFGFMDAAEAAAKAYPNIIFEHIFGYKRLPNLATFGVRAYQTRYLTGIMAGMMTKSNKIGYIATFPIPQSFYNLDSFALGVKQANPNAKIHVVWTGSWYDPVIERQAAEAVLDLGADVIAMHAGSTAPMVAAEERGVYSIGWESDMAWSAPKAVLTSIAYDWALYYYQEVKAAMEGTWKTHDFYGGIDTKMTMLTPYGPMVPQEVKDKVSEWEAKIKSGWDVFVGPIKDDKGTIRVPEGTTLSMDEINQIEWITDNIVMAKTK